MKFSDFGKPDSSYGPVERGFEPLINEIKG